MPATCAAAFWLANVTLPGSAFIQAISPLRSVGSSVLRARLDLTVEAVVVENARWHFLITPEELDLATMRPSVYGYTPQVRLSGVHQTTPSALHREYAGSTMAFVAR